MKLKVGDRVAMYGAGDGKHTFWAGDKGKVLEVGRGHLQDMAAIVPDEYPNEIHNLHHKQLRKLRKPRKHGYVAWAVYDSKGYAHFFLTKKMAKSHRNRLGGELVEYREISKKYHD